MVTNWYKWLFDICVREHLDSAPDHIAVSAVCCRTTGRSSCHVSLAACGALSSMLQHTSGQPKRSENDRGGISQAGVACTKSMGRGRRETDRQRERDQSHSDGLMSSLSATILVKCTSLTLVPWWLVIPRVSWTEAYTGEQGPKRERNYRCLLLVHVSVHPCLSLCRPMCHCHCHPHRSSL